MVRTPFAGASACLLIGGGDQVWQMWLLPLSFEYTRGTKGMVENLALYPCGCSGMGGTLSAFSDSK
jgi:hypothetical protein